MVLYTAEYSTLYSSSINSVIVLGLERSYISGSDLARTSFLRSQVSRVWEILSSSSSYGGAQRIRRHPYKGIAHQKIRHHRHKQGGHCLENTTTTTTTTVVRHQPYKGIIAQKISQQTLQGGPLARKMRHHPYKETIARQLIRHHPYKEEAIARKLIRHLP